MEIEEIVKRLRSAEDPKAESLKIIDEYKTSFHGNSMRESMKIAGILRDIKRDRSNDDVIFFLDYIFEKLEKE